MNDERIRYYFGDFYDKKIEVKINEELKTFNLNKPYFYKGPDHIDYKDNKEMCPCFWWNHDDFCLNIPCIAISSDGYDSQGLPAFTKARLIDAPNNGILLKLNINRHWKVLDNPLPSTPWKDKKSEVIWRGNHVCGSWKKPNRLNLVEMYHHRHNVRFWSGTNFKKYSPDQQKYYANNPHLFDNKESTIEEQIKYKYIISIEGNDVSSGLKWMLASNSLVIMPAPKIESWLMEGLLEPWRHYVPLNSDLSDLDEIVHWCKSNDEKCQEIVNNANVFMSKFLDKENEKKIFIEILNLYKKNIILI